MTARAPERDGAKGLAVVATAGTLTLARPLPADSAAYMDADWVPDGRDGPVPAIVAASVQEAAGALLALANEAVDALAQAPPGSIEVLGSGLVAHRVRALLGPRTEPATDANSRPSAVVDASGDPEAIAAALRRLRPLGVLVLAGEPLERRLEVDLYQDVHSRGLRVVGVGPAAARADGADADGLALAEALLVRVAPGKPFVRRDGWYVLS